MARLSGPLLDRIDIHADVPALSFEELSDTRASGPSSAEVAATVQVARDLQRERYNGSHVCNAHLDSKTLRKHCILSPSAEKLLETALNHLGLSARAFDKVLRVARTLADLDFSESISDRHITEAVQYRSLDRQMF